ncbi:MAG TPA: hypothetical protein VL242_15575, partial [Sorangium sp.]|nr:hypothetical protein [Sorangium sp.]
MVDTKTRSPNFSAGQSALERKTQMALQRWIQGRSRELSDGIEDAAGRLNGAAQRSAQSREPLFISSASMRRA